MINGEYGHSDQVGRVKEETSPGQRQLGWSSLYYPLSKEPNLDLTSRFMEITEVLLRGGGPATVKTTMSMKYFKRIHTLLNINHCQIFTRYIPSTSNPVNGPSRGIFPLDSKVLPPVDPPSELEPVILAHDHASHGICRQFHHNEDLPRHPISRTECSSPERHSHVIADLDTQFSSV